MNLFKIGPTLPGIGLKEQRQGRDAGAVSGVIKVQLDIVMAGILIFIPSGGQGTTNRSPCNLSSKVGLIINRNVHEPFSKPPKNTRKTKGVLKLNLIIFRNTWVLGYNMGKADLTNLFIEGQKVSLEAVNITVDDRKKYPGENC